MNQTNNRIREEIQKDLDDGKFYSICSNETTFKNYIFELLKSQRDSLVDRLPECAWCDLENGRGKYLLESDIINLIKNN